MVAKKRGDDTMPDFKKLSMDIVEDVIRWRHQFHKQPELSFVEYKTTERIVEILKEIGFEDVQVGIPLFPKVGVTANLNPGKKGPCILLRADMDALPIDEMADVEEKSQHPGIMHACGHDGHVSMLLGVAKILFQLRDEIKGNVRFIFQPGEEDVMPEITEKTGAQLLSEDGDLLDGVDVVFGLHVWGTLPSGILHYKAGPLMTSNVAMSMDVEGVGGHGAMPHACVDPVVALCQIVTAWQTIVSREINPMSMAVITVGSIGTESAWNVIPAKASLSCGMRTLDDELMTHVEGRMKDIAEGIAKGLRCRISYPSRASVPAVVNDKEFTAFAVRSIEKTLGSACLAEIEPMMASEDFAWYQKKVPGLFMFLGTGKAENQTNFPQHDPRFKVDDEALSKGVAAAASVAYDFVNQG